MRRVSPRKPSLRQPGSGRAQTRTSGIRSLRKWAAAGKRSRALQRSGIRPCLSRQRLWASQRRPLLGWLLVWARI